MAHEDVTRTVSSYVPGMESDPEFCGVSFRRPVPEALRAAIAAAEAAKDSPALKLAIAAKNKAGSELAGEICKKYGVKPLGAVSAPGGAKTLENYRRDLAINQAMFTGKTIPENATSLGSDKNLAIVQKAFKAAKGKEVTLEAIREVLTKLAV